ncbi:MAG: hypothetical protein ACREUU_04220, partial [Gammaproteobacteria bacterium]
MAIIAGLYLWENRKQREWQRRSTVLHEPRHPGLPGIREHTEIDAAETESDSRNTAPDAGSVSGPGAGQRPAPMEPQSIPELKLRDLFGRSQHAGSPDPQQIIAVHLASPPGTS